MAQPRGDTPTNQTPGAQSSGTQSYSPAGTTSR